MGMLNNEEPRRVRIDDEWFGSELGPAENESVRLIRRYQRTPMWSAMTWAGLPADTALADSLLMFDRRRLQTGLPSGDAAPSSATIDRLPSYPLTLCAYDEPQIHPSLIFARHRFAESSAQRMLEQLRSTLIEFASQLSVPLADLDLGRIAEVEILAGWNRTRASYPADATAAALFAAQVAGNPDATAVVFGAARVTYA